MQQFPVYKPNCGLVGLWLLKVSCSCCEHTTDCQGRGAVGGVCGPLGCAAPAWSPRWYTPVRVWRGSGGLLEGSAVQLAVQPRRRSVPIWAACVWWVLWGRCYWCLPSLARLCVCRNWSRFRLRCCCDGEWVVGERWCSVYVVAGAPGTGRALGLCRIWSAAR